MVKLKSPVGADLGLSPLKFSDAGFGCLIIWRLGKGATP